MRRILLLHRRWWFFAAPALPAFALVVQAGEWFVNDAGDVVPDGWMMDNAGNLFIDDAASSGLALSVVGGEILVEVP